MVTSEVHPESVCFRFCPHLSGSSSLSWMADTVFSLVSLPLLLLSITHFNFPRKGLHVSCLLVCPQGGRKARAWPRLALCRRAPKSLRTATAAMRLKNACSWEGTGTGFQQSRISWSPGPIWNLSFSGSRLGPPLHPCPQLPAFHSLWLQKALGQSLECKCEPQPRPHYLAIFHEPGDSGRGDLVARKPQC